jgi:hypothetical protein
MVAIYSPAFVVGAKQACWKCGSSNEVVTLASNAIRVESTGAVDRADTGEIYLLSYIGDMPVPVFQHVSRIAPRYQKLFSLTADHAYYANVCMCGANFGDWFLFCEPGGAWFPDDGADVQLTRASALPFADPLFVECGYKACKIRWPLVADAAP